MTTSDPIDLLARASALLRETVAAASADEEIASVPSAGVARYVNAIGPVMGLALADWLESTADAWPRYDGHTSTELAALVRRHALAMARILTGEQT